MSRYISKKPVPAKQDGFACGQCSKWWTTERAAIYCCATDSICDRCGGLVGSTHRSMCQGCSQLRDREKWEAIPVVEWDGECPLVEFRNDAWFASTDEVEEYIEEHGIEQAKSLMLVHSKPRFMRPIEDDYWCDDLPEETGIEELVSKELWEALQKVNELGAKTVISYWPDNRRRVDVSALVDELLSGRIQD